MTEEIIREHQEVVEEIRSLLTEVGVAHRRPQMIYNVFYHPDLVVTVNGKKFIPIEVINSSYGFDTLGILSLAMTKDIVSHGVIIVTDKMYQQNPEQYQEALDEIEKFNKYSKGVYGNNIVVLRENEVSNWFKNQKEKSGLWEPTSS